MLVQERELLFIGQVTARSGISIKTIRYYEELGLLRSSGRSEGGFRLFSSDVLPRLTFIKRAQGLGLSLQEIAEILQVYDQGELPCGEMKQKLEDKVLEIDHQIEQLLTLQSELKGLLSGWKSFSALQPGTICPNVQADSQDERLTNRK